MRLLDAIPVTPVTPVQRQAVLRAIRVRLLDVILVILVILAQRQAVTRAIRAPRLLDRRPANALYREWAGVIHAIPVRRQVATPVIPVTPVVPVAMYLN